MSRPFRAAALTAAGFVVASGLVASSLTAQDSRRPEPSAAHRHHAHGSHADSRSVLLSGLGDWHHSISTRSPRAQQFFDQGLRLAYAFNHDEAARSFAEAARLDPMCAMCWWGVAYAVSPNINVPMTPEAEQRALAAIRTGQRLAQSASPREREYMDAMSRRFGEPVGTDRGARDSAYATAMRAVAKRFPSDLDAQVLFADAMLNLRPWNQWSRDGTPQPGTLERSISLDDARANAALEAFLTTGALTHVRFSAWDSVLAQPAPSTDFRYARGMWHYARGLAHAARGNHSVSAAELDTLRSIAAATPASLIIILNPAPAILELAAEVLAGELALRQGQAARAFEHFQAAVRREDSLTYDEPPPWYHSTRHLLGRALLALGRAADAEAAFRDDLRAYRENGWALAGLELALRRQGRASDAAAIAARLAAAWRDADVPAIDQR